MLLSEIIFSLVYEKMDALNLEKSQLLLQTVNTIMGEFRSNYRCFKAREEEHGAKPNRSDEF